MRTLRRSFLLAAMFASVGCGSSELHHQTGKVALREASEFSFAGDAIELQLESNPLQRAFGQIDSDGSFHLETLNEGEIASGVKPGNYRARIVIADDDAEHLKRASKVIDRKFTRFETSGLNVQVPSEEEVVLRISSR